MVNAKINILKFIILFFLMKEIFFNLEKMICKGEKEGEVNAVTLLDLLFGQVGEL